jgi:hypothetical protein
VVLRGGFGLSVDGFVLIFVFFGLEIFEISFEKIEISLKVMGFWIYC